MPKRFIVIVIIAGIIGGVVGSVFSANSAKANFFDSIFHFLKNEIAAPLSGNATSTPNATSSIPLYKPVIDYEEAVISAVENANKSVVSIVVSKDLPIIEQCPYNPFPNLPPGFNDFFNQNFQFSQPCEKGTKKQEVGGGSGFIVSQDGLIVTNKHVASDKKAEYTVFTNDGKKYGAKVIATDPVQDLAIIKIDAQGLKPATLGNSDSVKLGQTAIAIGNALGEFKNTVSVGVISGLARNITASGASYGSEDIRGVIQTDAAINPGNSGGPLLNLKGEVISINTAIASGAQNIGFAIPINFAKRAIQSVKDTGTIKSPYLGVRYIMINSDIAKKQNLSVLEGALVRGNNDGPGVLKDSPADKGGVKAEDIITEVNGEKITSDNPLALVLQKYTIGDTITLTVQRGKDVLTLKATLEERPKNL